MSFYPQRPYKTPYGCPGMCAVRCPPHVILPSMTLQNTVRVPRNVCRKVPAPCHFTLNDPTKHRTGAQECVSLGACPMSFYPQRPYKTPYGCPGMCAVRCPPHVILPSMTLQNTIRVPRNVCCKVPAPCHFTLNDPTKHCTGAPECLP